MTQMQLDFEKINVFFRQCYEQEEKRNHELNDRAKAYITIQTLYLAAFAFKIPDLPQSLKTCELCCVAAAIAAAFLILSFITAILSMRILEYELLCDMQEACSEESSMSLFYKKRIADYTVATQRNIVVNNKRANALRVSCYLLAAGIVSHFVALSLILR